MGDQAFKMKLTSAFHKEMPEIEEAHLEKTVCLAQCAYKEKKCRQRIGFGGMLLRQIRFMGWRVWAIQIVSLLSVLAVIHTFFGSAAFAARHISYILCAIAVMMAWAVTPVIARSLKYKMYEIENASFFSGSRLLTAQMIIIIGGVITMLSVILWFMSVRYSYGISEVAFSMILPFLASGNLYLYLLRHVRPQVLIKVCNAAGIVLVTMIGIFDRRSVLNFMELPMAAGWVLCLLGAIFCALQVKGMWGQIEIKGI